jgi:DNA-binding NarL/FixJ family response regulator
VDRGAKEVPPDPGVESPIRILVAVRQPAIAEALAHALDRERDIRCTAFVSTGADAARVLAEETTDVLVIGLTLLAEDKDVEAIRRAANTVQARVVIVPTEGANVRWRTDPAIGMVVPFDADLAALIDVVRRAHSRIDHPSTRQNLADALEELRDQVRAQRTMIRSTRERLDAQKQKKARHEVLKAPLTKRERDVALLLQAGYDVTAISRRLGLSLNTVRGHVKQILWKTDAHSQLEAVAVCVRAGVLRGPHLVR